MAQRTIQLVSVSAILGALSVTASAQEVLAPIQFGLFGAAAYNMVAVGEDAATGANLPVTDDFVDGSRFVPHTGIVFTYNRGGEDLFGFNARISYDDRTADFGDTTDEVTGTVSYVTFEPGLLLNVGTPMLHMSLGPSASLLVRNEFSSIPLDGLDTTMEYDMLRDVAFGFWGSLSYDIPLTEMTGDGHQIYLTPFLGGSWMIDQVKASETDGEGLENSWGTISLRGGLEIRYAIGGN